MFYNYDMDAIQQLVELSSQMHLEPAEDVGCPQLPTRKKDAVFISHAVMPGGKTLPMLKTLLTSACERNCYYCPFRAGRDSHRATFKPEELAKTFMALHRGGLVEGMFLSSGIVNGGVFTQDKLIKTAEILRYKHGFRGYLHLKVMPGAERSQVERTMQLADRVSINLEAPNTQRLQQLAPRKEFIEELLEPLRWIDEIRRSQPAIKGWNGRWPSTTTQFVVGAFGESDLELLTTTEFLYQQVRLKRAYYSRFNPVLGTPLEGLPAESPQREHRLYQSSFLLRDYGFSLEELPFESSGQLPRQVDPKMAWAKINLAEQPVEINTASREELLRIPGLGPKSVNAILNTRGQGGAIHIQDLGDLRKIGVNPNRAAPFILLNGRRPAYQPSFW
jgi:predicted DNA-binding helix-hairpin-helix protein